MKDFSQWGIKIRKFPEHNYYAVWNGKSLMTIRFGESVAKELPASESEFYDIGINTKCNHNCKFCYVDAKRTGINFPDICETWNKWMNTFKEDVVGNNLIKTNKPFQIAIGSTGEPTIHPDFCNFLENVYNSNVVPNYTTNGITLAKDDEYSEKILTYTEQYVAGVAVSCNEDIESIWKKAVKKLSKIDVHINLHVIISDMDSVLRFINLWKEYKDIVKYFVLLPMMPSGRSSEGVKPYVFEFMENSILGYNMKNVAFGAHFIDSLYTSKVKTYLYPAESLSKNIILTKNCIKITPSSFNLTPIKEIKL